MESAITGNENAASIAMIKDLFVMLLTALLVGRADRAYLPVCTASRTFNGLAILKRLGRSASQSASACFAHRTTIRARELLARQLGQTSTPPPPRLPVQAVTGVRARVRLG